MRSVGRPQATGPISGIGAGIISRVISWVARIAEVARVSRVSRVTNVARVAVAGVPREGRTVAIEIHGSDAGAYLTLRNLMSVNKHKQDDQVGTRGARLRRNGFKWQITVPAE